MFCCFCCCFSEDDVLLVFRMSLFGSFVCSCFDCRFCSVIQAMSGGVFSWLTLHTLVKLHGIPWS